MHLQDPVSTPPFPSTSPSTPTKPNTLTPDSSSPLPSPITVAKDNDNDDNDDDEPLLDPSLFAEPSSYRLPSPNGQTVTHTLLSGRILHLDLVGHNPLWGHLIWNSSHILSAYLQRNPEIVQGKTVLELGAGAGLVGIVAHDCGAKLVVGTDYPDEDLVDCLRGNVVRNSAAPGRDHGPIEEGKHGGINSVAADDHTNSRPQKQEVHVRGLRWGDKSSIAEILSLLPSESSPPQEESTLGEQVNLVNTDEGVQDRDGGGTRGKGFDILILSDLVFNHYCHADLASTITSTLRRPSPFPTTTSPFPHSPPPNPSSLQAQPKALVFFTPYRPHLLAADMAFFSTCRSMGLAVKKVLEEQVERVMFEMDEGDEGVRRTVFGFEVFWEGGRDEGEVVVEGQG